MGSAARYSNLHYSRDLEIPCDQRIIIIYRWDFLNVNYHHAIFDGLKHCGSGYITILVSYVILQKHVTKVSGNFLGSSPLR